MWEDLYSSDIFCSKFALRKAIVIAKSFLNKMNNQEYNRLDNIINELSSQLDKHYDSNLNVILEDSNKRKIDSAVLTALNIASNPVYFNQEY